MFSFGALAQNATASVDADVTAGWERITAPDGRVSANMPCTSETVTVSETASSTSHICTVDSLNYVVSVSRTIALDKNGTDRGFGDYATNLADAKDDSMTASLVELEVGDLSAFEAWQHTDKNVAVAQIIELEPELIGMALVIEMPEGSLSPEERAAALIKARAFIASVEVSSE